MTTDSYFAGMSRLDAAKAWFKLGYLPMPVVHGQKNTTVKHGPWLDGLSDEQLEEHWGAHPDSDIALHTRNGLIVLDADTEEALAVIQALEEKHQLYSNMRVRTAKGHHYYYRQPAEPVQIAQAGFSSEKYPERVDIRCGSSYIIAPPSEGKTMLVDLPIPYGELVEMSAAFASDLSEHNKPASKSQSSEVLSPVADPSTPSGSLKTVLDSDDESHSQTRKLLRLGSMLDKLDPDAGYSPWLSVLMAVHHETEGSEAGLALVDEWSSRGDKYKGSADIEKRWQGFDASSEHSVTGASITSMLKEQGLDPMDLWQELEEQLDSFEPTEMEVIPWTPEKASFENPFLKYSLLGQLDVVRRYATDSVPVLGRIALKGQFTVVYANSNSGKTLITLSLLRTAIEEGKVDASLVFYANVDDGATGLLTKGELAEELGFHQLAEGYQGLTKDRFITAIKDAIAFKTAKDTLIILDTLKKFTDLMDKTSSSYFGQLIRQYTAVGGTVVALAHTNKNRDRFGNLVQTGTADIPQDADCTYLVDTEKQNGKVIATFRNTKARGPVPKVVQYEFSGTETDYRKLLDSVRELDIDEISLDFDPQPEESPEENIIRAMREVIKGGCAGRSDLGAQVKKMTGKSKTKIDAVYTKFIGSDPLKHHWNFNLGPHGVHHYYLLDKSEPVSMTAADSPEINDTDDILF